MGGRSGQSIGESNGGEGGGENGVSGIGSVKINNLAESTASDAEKIHKGDIRGYEDYVYNDIDGLNERSNNLKSTDELKKEVGRYISTDKIYRKDTVSMPREVNAHIQGLGKKNVDNLINKKATKSIKVSDINIVQKHVFEKPLAKAMNSKNYKVVVFEHKGKYYLNDGNHRVAAAYLNKRKNIKVVIEKVD